MRIYKLARSDSIRLGRIETHTWEDASSEGDEFRRAVLQTAQARADSTGRWVEIYASARAGGWLAERVCPSEVY